MIKINEGEFESLITKWVEDSKTHSESWHQSKVMDKLPSLGFEPVKIISASKSGISDIFATKEPDGQAWLIEMKHEDYKPKPLQIAKLKRHWRKGAITLVAYGYKDFMLKYEKLTSGWA